MSKVYNIALAGNPNCGKTTLFNSLTGGKQRIGNWPGVTVEKKEGTFKSDNINFNIVDLPGIYSLSAYSEYCRSDLHYHYSALGESLKAVSRPAQLRLIEDSIALNLTIFVL